MSSASSSSGRVDIQDGSSDISNASTTTIQDPSSGVGGTTGNDYHILPISILIIGTYFFTHYLFSKGILKPRTHKRLWNLLIMGGYLGTGITGVLLIFIVNLGIALAYREGINYWHVELALLMVIGTLIHFHIYRKPFKNMFKVLFGFKSSPKKNYETKSTNMSK
jgi:ABC-type transport system involved in multi-copper enzyme maturation permease subunit